MFDLIWMVWDLVQMCRLARMVVVWWSVRVVLEEIRKLVEVVMEDLCHYQGQYQDVDLCVNDHR